MVPCLCIISFLTLVIYKKYKQNLKILNVTYNAAAGISARKHQCKNCFYYMTGYIVEWLSFTDMI